MLKKMYSPLLSGLILTSTTLCGASTLGVIATNSNDARANQDTVNLIKEAFAADNFLNQYAIEVSAYNGVVTLSGTVDSRDIRDQMASKAQSISGVTKVINQINVSQIRP